MGFLSHRRRDVQVNPEQKWDFISLNDFKSTSWATPFAYGFLWVSLFISVAVYAVDVFTAYQLLAFNKWSSQIEPAQFIPFDISKWIFTVCILLSFANLAYELFRAVAIMRRGSVAECFLDSLAARLESIRMGSGRGYKRFLVFAELTKSKKGAEYIALFTFFSFQTWIRTILLTGPRQVINALTLYSVYNARLQINEANFEASISSFFEKIRALATEEPRQAVILSGMLFTVVVWIFSFLSLLLAALFFVFFLWNYIPREDGGLTGFCERKVNKRLKQIVSIKINKAMAEEERKRKKAELKAAKKTGEDRPMTMKPSLPVLGGDNMPEMPTLNRADTFASFVEKPSRPTTPGSFEMNTLGRKPPMPLRSETKGTVASQYSSRASLLASAADMGVAQSEPPAPTLPPIDLAGFPPARTATAASNRSYGPGSQPQRMPSNGSALRGYTASPATFSSEAMPSLPPPARSAVGPFNDYRGPGPNRPNERLPYPGDNRSPAPYRGDNGPPPYRGDNMSPYPGEKQWPQSGDNRSPYPGDNMLPYPPDKRQPFDDASSGRASPAPTYYSNNPMSPRGTGPDGYPIRSATNPMPPRGMGPEGYQMRSATNPLPPRGMGPEGYQTRSDTSSPAPRGMGPDGYQTRSDTNSPAPRGPDGYQSGSATNPVAPRGTPQFPPPSRAMTQPMQPSHQPTGSIGSLRSMQSAGRTYQAYHQQSASNSSLRNMVNAVSYDDDADNRSQSGYANPPPSNPMAANNNSQRGPPQRRDGNSNGSSSSGNGGNGWNQDLERGGSRY